MVAFNNRLQAIVHAKQLNDLIAVADASDRHDCAGDIWAGPYECGVLAGLKLAEMVRSLGSGVAIYQFTHLFGAVTLWFVGTECDVEMRISRCANVVV